jgi:ABC-type multidrug transport system fused ATPase/permease subunit
VLPGAFFSFITALLLAYDPARRLARLQINLERAVVNARMIYEILDEEPTQGDRKRGRYRDFARSDRVPRCELCLWQRRARCSMA